MGVASNAALLAIIICLTEEQAVLLTAANLMKYIFCTIAS